MDASLDFNFLQTYIFIHFQHFAVICFCLLPMLLLFFLIIVKYFPTEVHLSYDNCDCTSFLSDLSNKSHLKVLESRPFQNGPVSHPVSSSTAVHTGAQVTSTPLPNHSHVAPADAIHSGQGVKYTKTTTVTRQASGGPSVTTVTRVVGSTNEKEESTVSHSVTSGTLMEQKKVPLPGLGASHNLKPRRYQKMFWLQKKRNMYSLFLLSVLDYKGVLSANL